MKNDSLRRFVWNGTPGIRLFFLIILVSYCLYVAVFIYRSSFVINGVRYYSLFDDAMVSMTYARNLAHGQGLVWNAGGARVEGITNPLWTLYMAVFHFLPVSQPRISLCLQISGAMLLIGNLILIGKLAAQVTENSAYFTLWALVLTAFYLPLNNWGLQGMEVSALNLIVSAAVLLETWVLREDEFQGWLYMILGVGTLIRMDMAVFYLIVWGFNVLSSRRRRVRHLIYGLIGLAVSLGGQTWLRWCYYGELLPNTYYLKATGFPLHWRISRGLQVFWQFIRQISLPVFLLPAAMFFFRRDRWIVLMSAAAIGQFAYSVYMGGDAWEYWGGSNRYITIVMPVLFVLLTGSLKYLQQFLLLLPAFQTKWLQRIICGNIFIILTLALIRMNFVYDPYPTLKEWLLIKPPPAVEENAANVRTALLLREITDPDAVIGVVWAGAIPYFSQRNAVDFLGKSDKKIAREPAHIPADVSPWKAFYPGHMKWDYEYSIRQLRPDVIAQFYGVSREDAQRICTETGYCNVLVEGASLQLLKSSEHVLWERIKAMNYYPLNECERFDEN